MQHGALLAKRRADRRGNQRDAGKLRNHVSVRMLLNSERRDSALRRLRLFAAASRTIRRSSSMRARSSAELWPLMARSAASSQRGELLGAGAGRFAEAAARHRSA